MIISFKIKLEAASCIFDILYFQANAIADLLNRLMYSTWDVELRETVSFKII
jgi:hypothetical protein